MHSKCVEAFYFIHILSIFRVTSFPSLQLCNLKASITHCFVKRKPPAPSPWKFGGGEREIWQIYWCNTVLEWRIFIKIKKFFLFLRILLVKRIHEQTFVFMCEYFGFSLSSCCRCYIEFLSNIESKKVVGVFCFILILDSYIKPGIYIYIYQTLKLTIHDINNEILSWKNLIFDVLFFAA